MLSFDCSRNSEILTSKFEKSRPSKVRLPTQKERDFFLGPTSSFEMAAPRFNNSSFGGNKFNLQDTIVTVCLMLILHVQPAPPNLKMVFADKKYNVCVRYYQQWLPGCRHILKSRVL